MSARPFDDVFGPADSEQSNIERAKIAYAVGLERLRVAKNLTYKEVAKRYGKSPGYISRVFRGDENVTIGTMVKLARVLGGAVEIRVTNGDSQSLAATSSTEIVSVKQSGRPFVERRKNLHIGSFWGRLSNLEVGHAVVVGIGAGDVPATGWTFSTGGALSFGSETMYLTDPQRGSSRGKHYGG